MLAYQTYGDATAPPLLIAHGLYGSGRNWGVIAKRLSDTRHVITVDMRNHGNSFHSDANGYDDLAADLEEVIRALGGPMDVVGHSMGGKAAMMLALRAPDVVRRLVVGDIAPVTYTHSQLPMIDAMRAVDLSAVTRRSEANAQLQAQGVDPAICAFLTQSLDVAGQTWRLNLDALEAEMPKIMSFPQVTAQYDGPTLFLSGGASDYVLPEHRNTIRGLFPRARFAKLPRAGHWLHADDPRGFEGTVRAFADAAEA
ncbi:alpha/beta fold hydrolase [uncultured Tateyamaria sp.]|uniref:alpha/beta fold hydrolase n=1 Tax=Tateyamaria sp. 1078 TaxID=3417464 RepID=UPI00262EC512|nr:alpha/beta fold hydrolase [uncultured Tateyamaria sp.]